MRGRPSILALSWRGKLLELLAAFAATVALTGCAGTPTPLAPGLRGSIGFPHQGVITDAVALPKKGEGYALLRANGRNWVNQRLVAAVQSAAVAVARARPGGAPHDRRHLGALGRRGERAPLPPHRARRRSPDLRPHARGGDPSRPRVSSRFGPDGLAEMDKGKASPRIDLEREWLLV